MTPDQLVFLFLCSVLALSIVHTLWTMVSHPDVGRWGRNLSIYLGILFICKAFLIGIILFTLK